MEFDDAIEFIVDVIRKPRPRTSSFPKSGYDITIQIVLDNYMKEIENCPEYTQYAIDCPGAKEIAVILSDAAWELCRRGFMRPSVADSIGQGLGNGTGYTLTDAGRRWVKEGAPRLFLGSPDRLSQLFEKLSTRFGPGFLQRASEAAHCHAVGQYLACCTMCGAAAESILLAVAIAKRGDEDAILKTYRAASGRRQVIEGVAGQLRATLAEPFRSATSLLSFWRDEASHGLASAISEIEAYTALGRLIGFAQLATDNWEELTRH